MSLSISLGRRGLLLRCFCHHTSYLSEKRSLSRALQLGKNLIRGSGGRLVRGTPASVSGSGPARLKQTFREATANQGASGVIVSDQSVSCQSPLAADSPANVLFLKPRGNVLE